MNNQGDTFFLDDRVDVDTKKPRHVLQMVG